MNLCDAPKRFHKNREQSDKMPKMAKYLCNIFLFVVSLLFFLHVSEITRCELIEETSEKQGDMVQLLDLLIFATLLYSFENGLWLAFYRSSSSSSSSYGNSIGSSGVAVAAAVVKVLGILYCADGISIQCTYNKCRCHRSTYSQCAEMVCTIFVRFPIHMEFKIATFSGSVIVCV